MHPLLLIATQAFAGGLTWLLPWLLGVGLVALALAALAATALLGIAPVAADGGATPAPG